VALWYAHEKRLGLTGENQIFSKSLAPFLPFLGERQNQLRTPAPSVGSPLF